MPLKNSRTNLPMTRTTEAYRPMILDRGGRKEMFSW